MRSANSTRSGAAAARHAVEGLDKIRVAQPERQRLAGPDGESGHGTVIGVLHHPAAIQHEAGVGKRIGKGADAALGHGKGRRRRGGKTLERACPGQKRNERQHGSEDDDRRDGGDDAGDCEARQKGGDRDDQPAALRQPLREANGKPIRRPALRTRCDHAGGSGLGADTPRPTG